jgi:hypothetical protein
MHNIIDTGTSLCGAVLICVSAFPRSIDVVRSHNVPGSN